MKTLARKLLLALFFSLITLAVAELILRLFDPFGISYHAQNRIFFDPNRGAVVMTETGPRLEPNVRMNLGFPIKTDSLGFRDHEFAEKKPDGEYRILLIGDSVVFGWGVREEATFAHLVEDGLNERLAEERRAPGADGRNDQAGAVRNVEVINCGVPGWNGFHEYSFLKERGLALDPDLVLLFFIPDDVPSEVSPEELAERHRKQGALGRFLFSPWFESFYLKQFVKHLYWLRLQEEGVLEETIGVRNFDQHPEARSAYQQIVAEMVRMTREAGARFGFLDGLGRDYAREIAGKLKIPYIVVLPGYDVTPPEYRISDVDGHPNELCHRVMAGKILAGLREFHLVP